MSAFLKTAAASASTETTTAETASAKRTATAMSSASDERWWEKSTSVILTLYIVFKIGLFESALRTLSLNSYVKSVRGYVANAFPAEVLHWIVSALWAPLASFETGENKTSNTYCQDKC